MTTQRHHLALLAMIALFNQISGIYDGDELGPSAYMGRSLNEICHSDGDCGSFGFICARNRTCQCNTDYIADSKGQKCLGGIGQKCQYDEHCIDGAFCLNQFICRCKESTPYSSFDGLTCSDGSHRTLASICMALVGGGIVFKISH